MLNIGKSRGGRVLNVLNDSGGDNDANAENDGPAENSDGNILVLAHFALEIKRGEEIKEFESDQGEDNTDEAKDNGRDHGHSKRVRMPDSR